MKQIVDKLNKIAKKIDESVEIPQTDLIIDSLDAITKAYGGTPNDSNLIVDKLEDIYNNIEPAVSGNIEITENGENINVAPYATATVNVPAPAPAKHYVIPEGSYTSIVQGGLSGVYIPNSYFFAPEIVFNIDGVEHVLTGRVAWSETTGVQIAYDEEGVVNVVMQVVPSFMGMSGTIIPTTDTEATAHTISAYYVGDKNFWQIVSVKNSRTPFAQYETYMYNDHLVSEVVELDNDEYSDPILVYPSSTRTYCCYTYGTATSIVCSTNSFPTSGYYATPSDENNVAFITWADNAS